MSFESTLRGRKPRRGSSLQGESLLLPLWMTPNSTQLKYLGWRNQRLLLWVRLSEHHYFVGWSDLLLISFNLLQKSAKVKVTKSTNEDIFGKLLKMNQLKAATAASTGKVCHVLKAYVIRVVRTFFQFWLLLSLQAAPQPDASSNSSDRVSRVLKAAVMSTILRVEVLTLVFLQAPSSAACQSNGKESQPSATSSQKHVSTCVWCISLLHPTAVT